MNQSWRNSSNLNLLPGGFLSKSSRRYLFNRSCVLLFRLLLLLLLLLGFLLGFLLRLNIPRLFGLGYEIQVCF